MHIESTTGLYHFDDFKKRAQTAILENPEKNHYVITINVNNFKFVNQTYGYLKGDYLLKKIAEDFCYEEKSCLVACREYSDHFVIFGDMDDLTVGEFAEYMEFKIQNFHKSIVRAYPLFDICLNVGAYFVDDYTLDISTAVDRAELARRSIKGNYTTSFQMFDENLYMKSQKEAAMIPLFNRAMEEGWIFAYLQPKVEIETGKLIGAEALVRMVDENGVMVPPIMFIEKLERAGIIYQCDLRVLELVLVALDRWLKEGYTPVPISVNLSRVDFRIEEMNEKVALLLRKYKAASKYLEFEVTETAFVDELDNIIAQVRDIQNKGFKISVDDFGSGYSSLSTVSMMPVDVIKLDRSFVQNCIHSEKGGIVIQKIVEMFEQLELEVLCEGVETAEEEQKIFECGVKYVQGYVHDKPLPLEEFEKKYIVTNQ